MNSSPAVSAIWVMATMSSQFARQRSGARLIVNPPSQLALNTPSLNLFGPNSGLLAREGCMLLRAFCAESTASRADGVRRAAHVPPQYRRQAHGRGSGNVPMRNTASSCVGRGVPVPSEDYGTAGPWCLQSGRAPGQQPGVVLRYVAPDFEQIVFGLARADNGRQTNPRWGEEAAREPSVDGLPAGSHRHFRT